MYLVIVGVVQDRLTSSALIPRGLGLNDKRPKRAWLFIGFGLPIQAIMLSLGANELLRILQQRIFLPIALVVFALRVNVGKAYLNCVQLIATNAPVENFLFALLRVEAPTRAALTSGIGNGHSSLPTCKKTLVSPVFTSLFASS